MAKVDLNRFGKNVIKAAQRGLKNSADKTKEQLKINVGLQDHSLQELAKLGHPYHPDHYRPIHNPEWLVHRQSSTLYNSIKIVKENDNSYAIGADESIRDPETGERYVIDVIEGTSKMVARPYPIQTLNELVRNNTLYHAMNDELNKVKL